MRSTTIAALLTALVAGCSGSNDHPSTAEVEKVAEQQLGGHFRCTTNAPPHEYRCESTDYGDVVVTFRAKDGRIWQVGKADVGGPTP